MSAKGSEADSLIGHFENISVMFVGLLRNRREIERYLGRSKLELNACSTSQFLAVAYDKIGERLFEMMTGEFSCIIWNSKTRNLRLARDKFGQYPLFYIRHKNILAFASRPDKFGAIGAPPEIELGDVARLAVPDFARITNRPWFFKKVKAVRPAHFVTFKGTEETEKRYFECRIRPEVAKLSVTESNEQMRHILQNSVNSFIGLSRKPAILFSGGLDSSATAMLAADQHANPGRSLLAMTSSDFKANAISSEDDAAYVLDYAENPQIDLHLVRPDDAAGPFTDIGQLIADNYRPLLMSTHYQYTAFGEHAAAYNVDLVLDGAFGEFGPSYHGNGLLLQEFMKGKLGWVTSNLLQRSEIFQRSVWKQTKLDILSPLKRSLLENGSPWQEFFQPGFLADYKEDNVDRKRQESMLSHHETLLANIQNYGRAGFSPGFLGINSSAQRVYPFLDENVIEFGVSASAKAICRTAIQEACSGALWHHIGPIGSGREQANLLSLLTFLTAFNGNAQCNRPISRQ
ncbi:hypothetical protein C8024_12025 [Sphingopyxis sp. BSNA05]|uniref:asparagine synthase-related protein n=1 Tax=Sphingopyxis sp. BSNA05 TaxID=1236614 RepID=UPI0015639281|nr:asparagine synthase-related protein [Sphingopyxis sp. BSNA05]NRD90033.1 hypothetical protein [Sphingopyxis sp. BSNA05]